MAEYIKREAVIDLITRRYENPEICTQEINSIPAADVAPVVHGQWIKKSAPARKIYFECSRCGAQENKHTAIKGYYCWRCGAKMDGGASHEDD